MNHAPTAFSTPIFIDVGKSANEIAKDGMWLDKGSLGLERTVAFLKYCNSAILRNAPWQRVSQPHLVLSHPIIIIVRPQILQHLFLRLGPKFPKYVAHDKKAPYGILQNSSGEHI